MNEPNCDWRELQQDWIDNATRRYLEGEISVQELEADIHDILTDPEFFQRMSK